MTNQNVQNNLPLIHKVALHSVESDRLSRLLVFGMNSIYRNYRFLRTAPYWSFDIKQNALGICYSDLFSISKGNKPDNVIEKFFKNSITGCVLRLEVDATFQLDLQQYGDYFIEEFVTALESEVLTLLYYIEREQYKAQNEAAHLLLSLSSMIFEEGMMDNFLSTLVDELQQKMQGNICSMSVVKWSLEQETFEMPAVYEKGRMSLGSDKFPLDALKHRPIFRVIHNNKPLIMSKSENLDALKTVNVHSFEEAATIIIPMDLGYQSGAVSISSKIIDEFSCIDIALIESAARSLATIYRQNIIQSKMYKQANYDQLTSLANRAYFKKFLASLDLAQGEMSALLYIDLDKFKNINDSYGHDVGDKYLQVVAKRISNQLRDNDLAARIGGDEFAVVITRLSCEEDSERVAKRIIGAFSRPIEIEGIDHDAGVSIGICDFSYSCDVSLALVQADKAMYEAKSAGRGCFVKYKN